MNYGYMGKILRINLTKKTCVDDTIDPEILKKYLGGRGLGIWLLSKECSSDTDPFSKDSALIFCTGPFTGGGAFSAFYNVTANSPLTGTAGSGHAGGIWGPYLKKAGYDAIIIKGKADNPCYLHIDDGKAQILDASDLWGKNVKEIDPILKERHGKVSVASIGLGGENLVRYASIMNDVYRAVGRGGLGAVMGSKNLKAIVVGGKQKMQYYDRKGYLEIVNNGAKKALRDAKRFASYGTTQSLKVINDHGALPTYNFRAGHFDEIDEITGETMKSRYWVKDSGCYNCPLKCANIHRVPDGPFAIEHTEGPEFESLMAFGSNCGNTNLPSIILANDICNDYGIDTIETGQIIAMLFDLHEHGVLKDDFAPGLDFAWGNPETIIRLIELIGKRQGCGDILAEGSVQTARHFGKKYEKFAIHSKGQVFPGYEVRRVHGTGMSFATSNRGACHVRASMYLHEIFMEAIDPYGWSDEKIALQLNMEHYLSVADSLSMCKLGMRNGGFTAAVMAEMLSSLTGFDFTEKSVLKIGERIYNLERLYSFPKNLPAGEKFDKLPERLFEEDLHDGWEKGERLSREEFTKALNRYYELRQWNESGKPTGAKLSELGIQEESGKP